MDVTERNYYGKMYSILIIAIGVGLIMRLKRHKVQAILILLGMDGCILVQVLQQVKSRLKSAFRRKKRPSKVIIPDEDKVATKHSIRN